MYKMILSGEEAQVFVSDDITESLNIMGSSALMGSVIDSEFSPSGSLVAVLIQSPSITKGEKYFSEREYSRALSIVYDEPEYSEVSLEGLSDEEIDKQLIRNGLTVSLR